MRQVNTGISKDNSKETDRGANKRTDEMVSNRVSKGAGRRNEGISEGDRNVVGRAELKLAEAATAFCYDFRGKTVLDIGSSTGGFTEYALRRGAKKVVAIEKGTRQMKAPLRFDPRVELHEKTDFLEIGRSCSRRNCQSAEAGDCLAVPLRVDTVLADVSFVSLRVILAQAKRIVEPKADFLVMLKPQFEAKSFDLASGVVKNEKIRRGIIRDFELWLRQNGFLIIKKRDNELVGKNGNRERFYYLRLARSVSKSYRH